MRYSLERERIVVAGLVEAGCVRLVDVDEVLLRRRAVAQRRMEYGWLKIRGAELPHVHAPGVPALLLPSTASEYLHEQVGFSGRGVAYTMILCMNDHLQPMAVAVPHKRGRALPPDADVALQAAVLSGACRFTLAHNGPKQVDVERLTAGAPLLGVRFHDYVALTDDPMEFSSFSGTELRPPVTLVEGAGAVQRQEPLAQGPRAIEGTTPRLRPLRARPVVRRAAH